jgi:serine protease Do
MTDIKTTRLIWNSPVCGGVLRVLFFAYILTGAAQTTAQGAQSEVSRKNPQTAGREVLREYDDAIDAAAERALLAVVQIEVSGYGSRGRANGQKEDSVIERQHALGSGVIVDPDGYIMTNAHVVEGAQRIRVAIIPTLFELDASFGDATLLRERRVLDARLIGSNRLVDLALLKVEAKGLPYLPLQAEYRVRLGQRALAIGSPEGLEHTVTAGIVSAVARQLDDDHPLLYIQTDASINPGNSGGALVDREGNLIGINTFIYSKGGGSEGLGFAIPLPTVRFTYEELKKYGYIRRIAIGANPQTITPNLVSGLKLPRDWGVIISDVIPGGPAAKAGLKPRDIVVTIDGHAIDAVPRFVAWLYLHNRDRFLQMSVLRNRETVDLTIPVVEIPKGVEELADLMDPEKNLIAPLGVFLLDLSKTTAAYLPELRSSTGAVVVGRVDYEPRIRADLQIGDVISAVNGISISGADGLRAELDKLKTGSPVVLEIEREGIFRFVSFEME